MNEDPRVYLTAGVCCWLVVAVFGVMITAACWQTGRGPDEHPGAVPAGVVELSKTNYLFSRDTAATPNRLCLNASGDTSVQGVAVVPGLNNSLFVQCNHPQSWNDNRPIAMSWGNALLGPTISSTWVQVILGGLLTLCLLPGIGEGTANGWRRRQNRKRKVADRETRRDALAASYAREKITGTEFEQGLDRINDEELRGV